MPPEPVTPDEPPANEPKNALGQAARVVDLGLRVAVSCAFGVGGGFWLDRKLGLLERFPVFTIVGCFLGLAAGMVALVKGLKPPEPKAPASSA